MKPTEKSASYDKEKEDGNSEEQQLLDNKGLFKHVRYWKPVHPMDFKDVKKAIKGNRVLPESFDNSFSCQQGRWYRGTQ